MTDMKWYTVNTAAAARSEGWDLFDYEGSGFHEIQRYPGGENDFKSDAEAVAWVVFQAGRHGGTTFHKNALDAHLADVAAINALRVFPPTPRDGLHDYIIDVQVFAGGGDEIHVRAANEGAARDKAKAIAEKMFEDGKVQMDLMEVTISGSQKV